MSSVLARVAQVPIRTFTVTHDERDGVYYFTPEDIASWLELEAASITDVG